MSRRRAASTATPRPSPLAPFAANELQHKLHGYLIDSVHESRAHHDSVGDTGHLLDLLLRADAESDRKGLVGCRAHAAHEVLEVGWQAGPGACHTGDAAYLFGCKEAGACVRVLRKKINCEKVSFSGRQRTCLRKSLTWYNSLFRYNNDKGSSNTFCSRERANQATGT